MISDKSIKIGYIETICLKRFFSCVKHSSSKQWLSNNPEYLASKHISTGKPRSSCIINKILSNQNLSVSNYKLEELLKVRGVELNIPVSTCKDKQLLAELTGKSRNKGFAGVYMFIHKNTGCKYVGSSNLLRRRMDYYFKLCLSVPSTGSLKGKFLPLLSKEKLKAFKLIIFKLNSNIFSNKDALFLEQYHLLDKQFNLNTLRVVNAGCSKGNAVYVYDLTMSTLYYKAKSNIELKRVLKIHTETSKKYTDSKLAYLNKFFLTSCPTTTALTSNLPLAPNELLAMMQKERQDRQFKGIDKTITVEL